MVSMNTAVAALNRAYASSGGLEVNMSQAMQKFTDAQVSLNSVLKEQASKISSLAGIQSILAPIFGVMGGISQTLSMANSSGAFEGVASTVATITGATLGTATSANDAAGSLIKAQIDGEVGGVKAAISGTTSLNELVTDALKRTDYGLNVAAQVVNQVISNTTSAQYFAPSTV